MIASDALQYNFEDGESYKEADDQDESHCPLPILVSGINNTTFSGIPLSFTELLSNSSKISNKEISTQLEEANHAHESGVFWFSSFLAEEFAWPLYICKLSLFFAGRGFKSISS